MKGKKDSLVTDSCPRHQTLFKLRLKGKSCSNSDLLHIPRLISVRLMSGLIETIFASSPVQRVAALDTIKTGTYRFRDLDFIVRNATDGYVDTDIRTSSLSGIFHV